MKLKNILVINNLYPPQELGGYGRNIYDFANILRERGNQVYVLTANETALGEIKEVEPYVERNLVLCGRYSPFPPQTLEDPVEIKKILSHNYQRICQSIKDNKIEVCLIGNIDLLSYAIFQPLLENSIPIIHHLGFATSPGYNISFTPKHPLYHAAANSHFSKQNILNQGYPLEEASVVYPGAFVEQFQSSILPYRNKLCIAFAGLVLPYKGPQTLVEALGILHRNEIDFQCSIAGDTPDKDFLQELKDLTHAQGIANQVDFLGYLSRNQLIELYHQHNVLVFPSACIEGFGISQVEAMAAGLTLITTGTGGASEVVESDVSGLTFPPKDAEILAQKLSSLLQNPEQWKRLTMAGQERAIQLFNIEHSVDLLEEKFDELLLLKNSPLLLARKQEALLEKSLNLRAINLIIFPDWSQSEEVLSQNLETILHGVACHPNQDKMTLLIETSYISSEEVELLLSGITMNLLMAAGLEELEEIEISFLDELSQEEWRVLLSRINIHLVLNPQYEDEFFQGIISQVKSCTVEKFKNLNEEDFTFYLAENLLTQGQWENARQEYQRLIELDLQNEIVYLNLANCLQSLNCPEEQINILRDGVELYPTHAPLHFALVVTLQRQGKTQEAKQLAQQASHLLPKDYTFKILQYLLVPKIYHNGEEIVQARQKFIQGLQNLIDETSLDTPEDKYNALGGIKRFTNFYLPYQAQNDKPLQIQYGQLVHRILTANYPQWIVPKLMPSLDKNQKIRVGYISAYLHSYSGSLWLTGWLQYCDKNKFEIYCYYTGNSPDLVTQQFRDYSDVFHHIPGDQDAVCQQIIEDNLHILVFPEIGMDPPTMQMAGLRLAPVQCVAWGHPVTTGLNTLDYFLSSELMEPENAQEHYSETLIQLPNIGVAYPQPHIPPLIKTRKDFDLDEDKVIYLCCQAPFKYLPQYDYILPEIALRVPQAQFLFLRGNLFKKRLQKAFLEKGLNDETYCIFRTIPERSDYLAINCLSDIYLDTFTWSGGNTSLEAIACHLPIITCPGEFMRGRHSDSFLKMIDITETIAKDEKEYVDIAVKLGLDSNWRNRIVKKLRNNSDRLYDDRECVRGLEKFYQQVVEEALIRQRKQ